MPNLHVCSLARLPETVGSTGAADVVTLINVGTPVERPATIAPSRHRIIEFSDIVAPMDGHVLPASAHVESLIDFVRSWSRERPLLIHCFAGISRSTAAAYVAACALAPGRDEHEIARALRAASPSATPNALLIEIADSLLERDGRMVAAVKAIGRGREAFEGTPFCLTLTAPTVDAGDRT